ncbi:NepR family anti-sigma factor [Lichenicoccus sp.]|uniref:NepR family anti-sigma factor n=1 Tax=Lichenicoccus sp. TaxID=2781899 RepID=UPI003D141D77
MTRDKDGRESSTSGPARRRRPKQDGAFDLWLARGLHQMFDDIANEPIPEELLRLIQNDEQQG